MVFAVLSSHTVIGLSIAAVALLLAICGYIQNKFDQKLARLCPDLLDLSHKLYQIHRHQCIRFAPPMGREAYRLQKIAETHYADANALFKKGLHADAAQRAREGLRVVEERAEHLRKS